MGNLQIAIHERKGSFSDRWIEYCKENKLPYKVVDCCSSDIITQLKQANALLWHWSHLLPRDVIAARGVIKAGEMLGLRVFPNTATCWHFDDKIAQKYLLEAIDAPLVPTYVFYNLSDALDWIGQTSFPKVFKLRKGAGSSNVKLVRSRHKARRLAEKSFRCGFKPAAGYTQDMRTKIARHRDAGNILDVLKRLPRAVANIYRANAMLGREIGYIYFQDFIPGNQFDTRITIIGDRAFAFTRNVRKNDFRASGSGSIDYDLNRINLQCVNIAFEAVRKIGAQSLAFDFVTEPTGEPKINEISYAYQAKAVYDCPGYWDNLLGWYERHMWPQDAILIDMLDLVEKQ